MFLEEIKNISAAKSDLKKFGITVGLVLIAISMLLLYKGKHSYIYFTGAGLLLFIPGLIYPEILKLPHKAWMTLAVILGFISTRVILSLLFYLVMTPIGTIAKLAGKDFLDEKISREKTSYWNYREIKPYNPKDSEAQF